MRTHPFLTAVLLVGLGAASVPAMAMKSMNEAPGQQGVVTAAPVGGTISIDGKTYLFNPAQARLHDASGKLAPALNLSKGVAVRFAVKQEGQHARITELWMPSK